MEDINTNTGIKKFFENNWLTLLLILGAALAFYFGFQRMSELNQRNSEMNSMLEDQRNSINENHQTINNLNKAVVDERAAREALRAEYENQLEQVRANLQEQIDLIRRRRIERTTQLANNPSELVNSYNSTFGFGRTASPTP